MKVQFNIPTLPGWEFYTEEVRSFYETHQITNGSTVRRFESEVRDSIHAKNVVAVSCCTSGLMLVIRCMGLQGKVALPSYTFFASAHALVWNKLEPVFVDVEEDTWNISMEQLKEILEHEERVVAMMPVHIFGNPCDVCSIEETAKKADVSVIYDAAHAMGSKVGESYVGLFGDAEVFSLSPTKLVVAGEGGIITTGDEKLAELLRAGRDYGNSGDYNPCFVGLNARMSEFHAALAIESFRLLEINVQRRNEIAARYKSGLAGLPGLTFQVIREGNRSTYKDFTVMVDEEKFGLNRDALGWHLAQKGVDTRKYYDPPVHRTKAYWDKWGKKYDERLPVTNKLSRQALSLPIWSHMEDEIVDRVAENFVKAQEKAEEIRSLFQRKNSS